MTIFLDKIKNNEHKLYCIFLLLIFFIGFVLRLSIYLFNSSFWGDEIAIMSNLNRSYLQLFQPLDCYQVTPPMFLVLIKFAVKIFGENEMSSRLIPFLFSIGSLFLFPLFAKIFLKKNSTQLITYLMFAISLPLIWYSAETKPYIIDVFFVLLNTWIFSSISTKISNKKLLLFGIITGISIWFSIVMSFILPCLILVFLIYNRKNLEWKNLIYLFVPICLSFAAFFIYIIPVIFTHYTYMHDFWFEKMKKATLFSFFSYFFQIDIFEFLFLKNIIILCIMIFFKNKNSLYVFVPIAVSIILNLLNIYPLKYRLSIYIFPFVFILITYPMELSKRILSKIISTVFIICILFFLVRIYFVSNIDFLTVGHRSNVWSHLREHVKFINDNCKKDDILFIIGHNSYNFYYYVSKYNIENKIKNKIYRESYNTLNINDLIKKLKEGYNCWLYISIQDNIKPSEGHYFVSSNHIFKDYIFKDPNIEFLKIYDEKEGILHNIAFHQSIYYIRYNPKKLKK